MLKPLNLLVHPKRVFSRNQALVKDSPIPNQSGIYAWFFKEIPNRVITNGCITFNDLTLLYIGISPKRPSKKGKKPSQQTLRKRIRFHYKGNAEGSALRLTLGCLLSKPLEITLRRVGSGKRMTFTAKGEKTLSYWMEQNAYVSWIQNSMPWNLEKIALNSFSLPLNLQGNENHPFYPILSLIRKQAKNNARNLPIVPR